MKRIANAFWILTVLGFLAILLYTYANLPESVGIREGAGGLPDTFLSRESFFYIGLLIFLLVNGTFFGLRNILVKRRSLFQSRHLNVVDRLQTWLLGFAASLNLMFIFSLIYLGVYNNPENLHLEDYAIFVYLGPILVGIMLVFLPFVFLAGRRA